MKELSIEEKAKAYDEAYEKVAVRFGSNVADEIFQELKESEDDRMKKLCISVVKQFAAVCRKEDKYLPEVEKCITWLEKHGGEQNLVNTDLDELVIQLEETIGTSPHSRETIKDFFQKVVQKYMKCLQIANGEIGRLMDENYRLKEGQKPAWSEEDEKQARQIERIVHDDGCTQKLQKQIADWLKFLKDRVQPKQEWSEEDKEIRNELISHFESLTQCLATEERHKENKRWLNWLKSLRPQNTWKPSDEQIVALRWVLNNIPYNKHKEEISGLLDQIKEL